MQNRFQLMFTLAENDIYCAYLIFILYMFKISRTYMYNIQCMVMAAVHAERERFIWLNKVYAFYAGYVSSSW